MTSTAERLRTEPTWVARLAGRPLWALGSIVALYLVSRAAVIATSVVPARDGERYLVYAQALSEQPFLEVVRGHEDHPGFPLLLWAGLSLGRAVGLDAPRDEVLIAQWVSALCGLVLVLAAYALARRVWCPSIAWLGVLGFVILPRPMLQTADLLSDPAYAALALIALVLFARSLDGDGKGRGITALFSGVLLSLAYWVRVDALVVGAAFALAAGALALRGLPVTRMALARVGWSALGFALGLGAFRVVCGRFSGKPVLRQALEGTEQSSAASGAWPFAWAAPVVDHDVLAGFGDIVSAIGKQVQYFSAVLVGLLVVCAAARLRRARPAALLTAAVLVTAIGALAFVRWRVGYASVRYLLVASALVPCASVYALALFTERFSVLRARRGLVLAAWLVVIVCVSVPTLVGRRLHDGYHGATRAAEWVAGTIEAGDSVYESTFFPAYLAGLASQHTRSADALRPESTSGGRRFLILDARDVATDEALRKFVESAGVERGPSYPRRPGGGANEIEVYIVPSLARVHED